MYCIYRITNLVNGKTYIGQHEYKETPCDNYTGSGVLLHKAYEKYGIENFIKDIIVDGIESRETIDKLETDYIAFERLRNPNMCYNIADGGRGRVVSEEKRRKLSEVKKGKGKKRSDETRRKLSEIMKEKWQSEEFRKKRSEAQKGKHSKPHKPHNYDPQMIEDAKSMTCRAWCKKYNKSNTLYRKLALTTV